MSRCLSVSVAIAFALTMHARRSAACSDRDACSLVEVLPSQGAVVPANAPALAFYDASVATNFELRKAGGERIETTTSSAADPTTKTKFLFLSSPLTEGEAYELRWSPNCSDPSVTSTSSASFTAGPNAPLPTTMGTVNVTASVIGQASSCFGYYWHTGVGNQAAAFFDFTPSAELAPYLPLTKIIGFVDGQPADLELREFTTLKTRLGIRTVCVTDASDTGSSGTVTEGLHHIRLEAIVAGASSQPTPLEFDATVQCKPSSTTTPEDASEPPTSSAATPESSSTSSCAVGPIRPAGASFGIAAAVGAVASSLLRRRRNRARH